MINFQPFPSIKTARLILREITDEDVNEIFLLRSDPDILRYLDRDPAKSVSEAVDFIKRTKTDLSTGDGINWGICLNTDPKLVGTIAFWRIVKEHHRAEIGYWLHPQHQSRGYASEAMAAVLEYGFRTIGLHSVEANVNPANEASIKLLEKHHFVKEAHFRENWFYNGKFIDSAIYSLLNAAA